MAWIRKEATGAAPAARPATAPPTALRAVAIFCMLASVALAGPFAPAAAAQDFFADLLTGLEVMIGESVAAGVIEENGRPVRLVPQQQQWVDRIFADVVAQAGRREIEYSLQILHSDVVNAFAAPGGYLFITTGMLRTIGWDEDALASVLGHEVAHVEHRHGMNSIMRHLGVGLLIQLAFGGLSDETWQTMIAVATELMRLGWSRDQEHEADDLGQRLAARAGYDPEGMVRFFQVMQELEGAEVPFLEFLSTHPLTSERIQRARERAAALKAEMPFRAGLPGLPASPAGSAATWSATPAPAAGSQPPAAGSLEAVPRPASTTPQLVTRAPADTGTDAAAEIAPGTAGVRAGCEAPPAEGAPPDCDPVSDGRCRP